MIISGRHSFGSRYLYILVFFFLAGVLLGLYFIGEPLIYNFNFLNNSCFSLASFILLNSVIFIFVCLSATSFIGVILIPLFLFLKGFLLTFSVFCFNEWTFYLLVITVLTNLFFLIFSFRAFNTSFYVYRALVLKNIQFDRHSLFSFFRFSLVLFILHLFLCVIEYYLLY